MNEDKLAKEFEIYKELAKQDKKIDVASLMIDALQKHQANMLQPGQKRWAYLVSLVAPPFGLIYAVKFYFSDKDDAKQAAILCLVLTVLSLLLLWLLSKMLFSTGVSSLKPSDLQGL